MDPIKQAGARIDAGDIQAAIRLLEPLLQAQPNRDDARYLLGLAWLRAGNPAKAQAQLLAAVQLSPQNYKAAYELGRLLESQGKTTDAIKAYRIARQARPTHQKTRAALQRLGVEAATPAHHPPRSKVVSPPSGAGRVPPKVGPYATTPRRPRPDATRTGPATPHVARPAPRIPQNSTLDKIFPAPLHQWQKAFSAVVWILLLLIGLPILFMILSKG